MKNTVSNIIVSVIIPVYNVEKFIDKCINSVINQTYTQLDILIIDDGSTDNSSNIVDNYASKDKRIRVFHKANGGISSARNYGLDKAIGDYILFVDSDDYIEENMIESMLKAITNADADDAICLEEKDDMQMFKNDIYIEILRDKIGSQLWRHLFKASLFNEARYPLNRYAEDMMVICKILYHKKIVFVPKKLYHYYQANVTSVSNNKKYKFKNCIDRAVAFSDRYIFIKNKDDIDNETKDIVLSRAADFCLSTFLSYKKGTNDNDDKDVSDSFLFLKHNKKEIRKNNKISFIRKKAIFFLLHCPFLFNKIGRTINKIRSK